MWWTSREGGGRAQDTRRAPRVAAAAEALALLQLEAQPILRHGALDQARPVPAPTFQVHAEPAVRQGHDVRAEGAPTQRRVGGEAALEADAGLLGPGLATVRGDGAQDVRAAARRLPRGADAGVVHPMARAVREGHDIRGENLGAIQLAILLQGGAGVLRELAAGVAGVAVDRGEEPLHRHQATNHAWPPPGPGLCLMGPRCDPLHVL